MDMQEFEEKFKEIKARDYIKIICNNCNKEKTLQKHKAKDNIKKNGQYCCQACRTSQSGDIRVYSNEGRKKISEATSYKRSNTVKQKMSESAKKKWKTEWGKKQKIKLSKLASEGHAANKFENSKRAGYYNSTKVGPVFYGSSYELKLCHMLDEDESVKTYETQIAYEAKDRGRCLDFLITYTDGTKKAVEVKPKSRLGEEVNIDQISDSRANAEKNGWEFAVYTEDELGMAEREIMEWADEIRSKDDGIDRVALRKENNNNKVKKYYKKHIAQDKVEVYCNFCNETHTPLRLTYERNIKRNNGEYICERHGGYIAGKKPKKKKENPYAAEGKKQCTKCNQVKPFNAFGLDKSRSDGYSNRCRECRKGNSGKEKNL